MRWKERIVVLVSVLLATTAMATVQAGKLYWADSEGLKRGDLDGSDAQVIVNNDSVNDIALDLVYERIYWFTATQISRASLDGSGEEVLRKENRSTFLRIQRPRRYVNPDHPTQTTKPSNPNPRVPQASIPRIVCVSELAHHKKAGV